MVTPFKTCTRCGKVFHTREGFLAETALVCDTDFFGLTLANCACGTTLAVEATLAFPHRTLEFFRLWKTDQRYRWVFRLREARIKRLPAATRHSKPDPLAKPASADTLTF